ncbi:MAG TPA: hypothetical protein VK448_07805 [Dissulfurispiraceae bacterium]|nr:hypothetical protein [Dissulfurispiraceae bacterium]
MKITPFRAGAAAGGLIGIVIAAGMDYLSGDVPGGGWTGAVAHDFDLPQSSMEVLIVSTLAIAVMVFLSAVLGGFCGIALERFFKMFTQE